MKKIFLYVYLGALLLASCKSSEVEFDDYSAQTIYFPTQYPVRSLILNDDEHTDNSIDMDSSFTIGVAVGGVYKNNTNRIVKIKPAPELVNTKLLITNATVPETLVVMPANYYTVSSEDEIVIPAGSFDGRVRVKLTQAFFNDPLSISIKYVIPFVINADETADSVLIGKPLFSNGLAVRTKPTDWVGGFLPKDFTLFAIKYTNRYHGKYFYFGKDSTLNATTGVWTAKTYQNKYLERNVIASVNTINLTESSVDRVGGNADASSATPKYVLNLKFNDAAKTIAISSKTAALAASLTGTGTFKNKDEGVVWNGSGHKTFYLNYTYVEAGVTHFVSETLVYRSSGILFQEYVLK